MSSLFLVPLVFLAYSAAGGQERPPHPLAPSIPQITRQEEARIQKIIDRFVQYDIGKLPKSEGPKALEDFNRLGPEAIFLLIDAFNDAANLEHSCPVVVIGKKIGSILGRSKDMELLMFARENIGAGVTVKRHMGSVKDLQAGVLFRKGAVQRELAATGGQANFSVKLPASMNAAELAQAARLEKGARLQTVLGEAGKRPSPVPLDILAIAAGRIDKDAKELARGMLVKNLEAQDDAELRKLCKHAKPEIRSAAASVAGKRGWGSELLELFDDSTLSVQKAAHQALIQLNRGKDLGPASWSSPGDRIAAAARWRGWWNDRKKSLTP